MLTNILPIFANQLIFMISIVMSFYNRQSQLNKTIESIKKSQIIDYEIIIIDDASTPPLKCPEAKIIRIEPRQKWWSNPCIPYNIGFAAAQGNKIIIQNPECYHVGDVLAYVEENLKSNIYITFACYAITAQETTEFELGKFPIIYNYPFRFSRERNGWYNHAVYSPTKLHFCSAITKADLKTIGGFSETYARGVAYEDNDFVRKIQRRNMDIKIISDPYVIHQYHPPFSYNIPGWRQMHEKNKRLYMTT